MNFDCSLCGCCCKRIGSHLPKLIKLGFPYGVDKNGWCEMLGEDNKCKVYKNRPDVCSVETMYYKYHSGKSKKEIYNKEAEICNQFQVEDKVNESYRVKLKK